MKLVAILLALMALSCCEKDDGIKNHLVSEQDGCRVYRTRDDEGERVYFTTCQGNTQWRVPNGKFTKTLQNSTTVKDTE